MDKIKKILYVSHRYHTNQVPVMKGWSEHGVEIKFFVTYIGAVESHNYVCLHKMKPSLLTRLYHRYVDLRYNIVKSEGVKSQSFRPNFVDIFKQLRSFKPDLVILRDFSLGNLKIILTCRLLGIKKIIMYVQEPLYGDPYPTNCFKEWIRRNCFPRVVFTPVLYNGKNRSKVKLSGRADCYIPLVGVIPGKVARSYCPHGVIRILYVGKYRPYKNHYLVINALSKVKKKDTVHLTIIGQLSNEVEQKYYDDLCSYVKRQKLENIIELRGDVEHEEMDKIYSQHDMLILASKELASIAVVEAMSNGLCVLGSIYNGTSCYLEEYDCGLTFDPSDENALVKMLDEFTENMKNVEDFGKKAIIAVNEHLCFDVYKNELERLIDEKYDY